MDTSYKESLIRSELYKYANSGPLCGLLLENYKRLIERYAQFHEQPGRLFCIHCDFLCGHYRPTIIEDETICGVCQYNLRKNM